MEEGLYFGRGEEGPAPRGKSWERGDEDKAMMKKKKKKGFSWSLINRGQSRTLSELERRLG